MMSNHSDRNPPKNLLAIDCGTQSIRALVFDVSGALIAKTQVPIDGYFSKQSGWVEQHVNFFWDALCRVCHKLWDETEVRADSIAGLSVTTQRASIICLDEQGEPLRPAIIWMDQRRATKKPTISSWWSLAFRLVGVKDTIEQFVADAEINWLRQFQPDIVQQTRHYLLLSGYFNYRLSGEFKDSIGNQVGYIPFDYKRHVWAKPNDWKWQACPIQPQQLPKLVPVGETLGFITEAAHQQTGLPKQLPIVAAAADKACETLGCGAVNPHQGQISYGTTATFNTVHAKYIEPIRFLPPYPAAIPRHFTCEFQIYRGYWMVSWFKEQFAHKEQLQADQQGTSTEALLDQQAQDIAPGADGLILQPYWSPGVRYPGPEARGAIIGFNDSHTKAHIYRALLEGIAFGLFEGKQKMQRRSGVKVTELFVSGGGSQSRSALQITADIFNLPVKVPATYETSGLGAAICVAVNRGFFDDFHSAALAMCHTREVIQPIACNVELYQRIYHRIYQKLYRRLAPFYHKISELMGPEQH